MKTVLFVPGYREDLRSRNYGILLRTIKEFGYKTKFVPVNWSRTVVDDWVKELNAEYCKHDPACTILAGFSFGAMTAFTAASERNPSELWLCSLSPYFAEDISRLSEPWIKLIGKRRMRAFSRLKFNDKAKLIRCKTSIFVGDLEALKYPLLLSRAKKAHKAIKQSDLKYVQNCGHDVSHPNYIESISSALS